MICLIGAIEGRERKNKPLASVTRVLSKSNSSLISPDIEAGRNVCSGFVMLVAIYAIYNQNTHCTKKFVLKHVKITREKEEFTYLRIRIYDHVNTMYFTISITL